LQSHAKLFFEKKTQKMNDTKYIFFISMIDDHKSIKNLRFLNRTLRLERDNQSAVYCLIIE
jgi:hypothetical protein